MPGGVGNRGGATDGRDCREPISGSIETLAGALVAVRQSRVLPEIRGLSHWHSRIPGRGDDVAFDGDLYRRPILRTGHYLVTA